MKKALYKCTAKLSFLCSSHRVSNAASGEEDLYEVCTN